MKSRKGRSLRELPIVLIEGRIAAGLTQRELAKLANRLSVLRPRS